MRRTRVEIVYTLTPEERGRYNPAGSGRPSAMFITFEGPDGGGKTTQIRRLQEALEIRGVAVSRTREPGGDFVGERVRDILLHAGSDGAPLTAEAELFLFAAARAQ